MQLIYKCQCMTKEREIVVTDRVANSPIEMWMELVVQPCLTYDHQSTSPLCFAKNMKYVKIKINETTNEVGVPEVKN